jgi:hypothetical protein
MKVTSLVAEYMLIIKVWLYNIVGWTNATNHIAFKSSDRVAICWHCKKDTASVLFCIINFVSQWMFVMNVYDNVNSSGIRQAE